MLLPPWKFIAMPSWILTGSKEPETLDEQWDNSHTVLRVSLLNHTGKSGGIAFEGEGATAGHCIHSNYLPLAWVQTKGMKDS